MIEFLDTPSYLVGLRISGSLTANDIDKAYKVTEKALVDHERISFFVEVDGNISFTLEGLLKDIWEGLGLLGKLSRYYRAAVVTDKGWIAGMARVEGLVFSSVDVRVFDPIERNRALAWASESPEPLRKPEEAPASVHFLQSTSEDVFAWEINGRLREKDVKVAIAAMKPYLERDEKFNVLVRIKDFGGFDLLATLDDDLIKLKYKAISKVDKYAVIGAKAWMRNLMELISPLFPTNIRFFDPKEEPEAWAWVGAEQALLSK